MFTIIQSHKTTTLLKHLGQAYAQNIHEGGSVFDEFVVLVPSMVIGEWLQKSIASEYGISTLMTTTFWGQYQWEIMQKVLTHHTHWLYQQGESQQARAIAQVPEVAVLSSTVMQWRLFAYFLQHRDAILKDDAHVLHKIFQTICTVVQPSDSVQSSSTIQPSTQPSTQSGTLVADNSNLEKSSLENSNLERDEKRLWQLATDFAKVFNRYLTHRSDWLDAWSDGKPVSVEQLIKQKDELSALFDDNAIQTPEWLQEYYIELEQAQRYLWQALFVDAYRFRLQVEEDFWRVIDNSQKRYQSLEASSVDSSSSSSGSKSSSKSNSKTSLMSWCQAVGLPTHLYLFTVQQLPLSELAFLKRLSLYLPITLFHYNPSQMFWADIVDKKWLQHQQIINPSNVYLRDYGHTLLSRMGKQSRETFASLANLSGNEYSDIGHFDNHFYQQFVVQWHDDFTQNDFIYSGLDKIGLAKKNVETNNSLETNLETNLETSLESNQAFTTDTDIAVTTSTALPPVTTTLLSQIQHDVLMLEDNQSQQKAKHLVIQALQQDNLQSLKDRPAVDDRDWQITYDDSLQIHSCHSLQRQLEVLREHIAVWLNSKSHDDAGSRQLSDIVVLLPDVESNADLIRSVFVDGVGQDGLHLPAIVTGVLDRTVDQLWHSICGYYRLLGQRYARFEARELIEWLSLEPMYESLGLTFEQMKRACDLLLEAGFIRGFDEKHLQSSLDAFDHDYRFSFAYALDRLVLGLTLPNVETSDCLYLAELYPAELSQAEETWDKQIVKEKTVPLASVTLADTPIIQALCKVYQSLNTFRSEYQKLATPDNWLSKIEHDVIHPLFSVFDQTRAMRAIFKSINGFRRSLRASEVVSQQNSDDQTDSTAHALKEQSLQLGLEFVLQSIEQELENTQISAEPSGVITFARFGALRTVPYKLIVMLNMNLSEFPRQDKDDRYDLMKAGLAKRGDRSGEDDDNGAFLDALLCATENCWIFYNGKSLYDENIHLPANPVSELLQFLQGEISWQLDWQDEPFAIEVDKLQQNLQKSLPKIIEDWLVTEHPPLPFSRQVFEQTFTESTENSDKQKTDKQEGDKKETDKNEENEQGHKNNNETLSNDSLSVLLKQSMQQVKLKKQQRIPPNPLWQNVYQGLKNKEKTNTSTPVELLSSTEYKKLAEALMMVEQLNQQVNQPAVNKDKQEASQQQKLIKTALLDADLLASDRLTKALVAGDAMAVIDINRLTRQVQHPAIRYLQAQEVALIDKDLSINRQEPLELDGLSNYQVQDLLIQSKQSADKMLFTPVLPAGVARQTTLSLKNKQIAEQIKEFQQVLTELTDTPFNTTADTSSDTFCQSVITPCKETNKVLELMFLDALLPPFSEVAHPIQADNIKADNVAQPKKMTIKGELPIELSTKLWTKMLPSTASGKHIMRCWLSHVFWHIARETTEEQLSQNDGMTICYFSRANKDLDKLENQQIIKFAPMTKAQAQVEMAKWLTFNQITASLPVVLMPEYGLIYLDKCQKAQNNSTKNNADASQAGADEQQAYYPKSSDFSYWLPSFRSSDVVYDSNSEHEVWQYVLNGSADNSDKQREPMKALADALLTLAEPLYAKMYESLEA